MHVHVRSADGEAKFWLEPRIELATSHGYNAAELRRVETMIEAHYDELVQAWRSTSAVEVMDISVHGLWLWAKNQEHFLPFDESPWFKQASVAAVLNVREEGDGNFHWPELDVDLCVESIMHPEQFPLKSRLGA